MRFSILIPILLLTACQSTTSSIVVTPPLIEYSDAQQEQALREYRELGPPCPAMEVAEGCSMLKTFVLDYKLTRDRIRALQE